MIRVFIQARMSSSRFPGKVLAPFRGKPIVSHVVSRVAQVVPPDQITVATSTDASDDPLALYVRSLGVPVYRGPLDNVFERVQMCLLEYPCDWFFRVCADSPLVDATLVETMSQFAEDTDVDLVTNVFPRTFPTGLSLEMLNAARFAGLDSACLSSEQQEHMTLYYYANASRFEIVNIESGNPKLSRINLCVDTTEDIVRLEQDSGGEIGRIEVAGVSVARGR